MRSIPAFFPRAGKFWCLVTCALWLAGSAPPVRAEIWNVGSVENFAPYNFTFKGKRTGIDTAIVEAILQRMNILPIHFASSLPEVFAALDSGKIDLAFQFVGTPERFAKYILVGPFRTGFTVLMTAADSDFQFRSMADLHGKWVGTVEAFSYTPEFDADTEIKRLPSSGDLLNIRRLLIRRVDVAIGDLNSLLYAANADGVSNKVRVQTKTLGAVPRYIAFPKSKADKAERFKAVLDAALKDGTVTQIIADWGRTNNFLVTSPERGADLH